MRRSRTWSRLGLEHVRQHAQTLTARMLDGLAAIDGVTVYGPRDATAHSWVSSASVWPSVDPRVVAAMLDSDPSDPSARRNPMCTADAPGAGDDAAGRHGAAEHQRIHDTRKRWMLPSKRWPRLPRCKCRGLNPATQKDCDMLERPWYHDGLRFQCTACGDCCTGAPGYVWVNKQEIEDLAAAMGYADVAEFERQYVRQVGVRRSLKERSNYDCVLLDPQTRKCRAYDGAAATVSHMAVLGLQYRKPGGLGADLPGMPGQRPGQAVSVGRH